jgi:Methyltransferase TRM13/CCCH zinc finger in TRM13 protein/U11-48K-like CHHC zinc finger
MSTPRPVKKPEHLSEAQLAEIAAAKAAKAVKKAEKKLQLTNGPAPEQCSFFLPLKKRYCGSRRAEGSDLCQAHMIEKRVVKPGSSSAAASEEVTRPRIPCPYDPSHSIYVDDLKKHRFRCPLYILQFLISSLPCYIPDCNAGTCANRRELEEVAGFASSADGSTTSQSSSSSSAQPQPTEAKPAAEHAEAAVASKLYAATKSADLPGIFHLLKQQFDQECVRKWISNLDRELGGDTLETQEEMAESSSEDPSSSAEQQRRNRHDLQSDAIVRHMAKTGMMDENYLKIEFGAGNATLGEAVVRGHPAATGIDGSSGSTKYRYDLCKLLLVEKIGGTSRRDFDIQRLYIEGRSDLDINRDKETVAKLMRQCFSRVRVDIAHFWLLGHPAFVDKDKAVIPAEWTPAKTQAMWKKQEQSEKASASAEGEGEPPLSKRPRIEDNTAAAGEEAESDEEDAADAVADAGNSGTKEKVKPPSDHKKESAWDAAWRLCDTCAPARCVLPRSLGDLIKDLPLDFGGLPPLPHHNHHLTGKTPRGLEDGVFKGRKAVLCAKHLCGGATDLALRCIGNALIGYKATRELAGDNDIDETGESSISAGAGSASGNAESASTATAFEGAGLDGFGGLAIATCCHHRCDWQSYVGKRWWRKNQVKSDALRELGVSVESPAGASAPTTASAFELIRLVSSWGPSFDLLAETGAKGGKRTKTLAVGGSSAAVAPGTDATKAPAADEGPESDPNLSPAHRRKAGRMAKRIIDAGRCEFLTAVLRKAVEVSRASRTAAGNTDTDNLDFSVDMRFCFPTSWSPENCLLVGEVKRKQQAGTE